MRHRLVALTFALSLSVHAKEVSGLQVPPTAAVDGKELKLNGAGTRAVFFIKIYVGALYVPQTSKDPAVLLGKDAPWQVTMTMLRDLEREKIAEAIHGGFERNNKDALPALKDRMEKLVALVPEKVFKGQTLKLTYVPGKGCSVSGRPDQIPGADFAHALLSVWLGKHPADDGLKRGLLGAD